MTLNENIVCIPVINERPNLEILLEKLSEREYRADVLVIDDTSDDGTRELISELNLKLRTNQPIFHDYSPTRRGVGNAHKVALDFAIQNKYRYLCTIDGDLTHDPSYLPIMIKVLNDNPDFDLVIGSRFLTTSRIANWSIFRIFLTHTGHALTQIMLGMKEDCSSGLRVYKVSSIPRDLINQFQMSSYDFFFKSAFLYKKSNLLIEEIPVSLYERKSGRSKMRFKDMLFGFFGVLLFRIKVSIIQIWFAK